MADAVHLRRHSAPPFNPAPPEAFPWVASFETQNRGKPKLYASLGRVRSARHSGEAVVIWRLRNGAFELYIRAAAGEEIPG